MGVDDLTDIILVAAATRDKESCVMFMRSASDFGRTIFSLVHLLAAGLLVAGILPISCDQNAQAVFRQTATPAIGEGVKTALGGDPAQGLVAIAGGVIDGAVASIVEAGDGPGTAD